MKRCSRCKEMKEVTEFGRNKATKDGMSVYCKECVRAYSNNYYKKNRSCYSRYEKKRYHNNENYRIRHNLRRCLRYIISPEGSMSERMQYIIGCSRLSLLWHLQSTAVINGYKTFNITNINGNEYNVDHIVDCSNYDLTDPEQLRKCFNYSNLQILSIQDHAVKTALGDRSNFQKWQKLDSSSPGSTEPKTEKNGVDCTKAI